MDKMSVTIFFGIRLSGRPYERISRKLNADAYSTYKVENLKRMLVEDLLTNYTDGLEFIYCGSVLDDSAELNKEGIKSGSTIHVFDKIMNFEPTTIPLNEESVSAASSAYRSVCFRCPGLAFPKVIRPEVLSKVLEKYPEFRNDLGAFAILKDSVLLEKMVRSQQAQIMGEQYPILVNSAKFVADTIIDHLKTSSKNPLTTTSDLSDSASENDSPQTSPNHTDNQLISRGQLAAALLFAGSPSTNSNTSRRSFGDEDMATTSSTATTQRITSFFTGDASSSSIQSTENSQQYAAQMQTMREMGLPAENSNLQALILCNGDIEAAVNLVLGIGNFT